MLVLIKLDPVSPLITPDVRPIGVGNCKRRSWLSTFMEDRSGELSETFESQQMKSGMQKLYTSVDVHCSHPEHHHYVAGTIDIKNTYQETDRAGMLRAIKEHHQWRKIYKTIWVMGDDVPHMHALSSMSIRYCLIMDVYKQGDPPATVTCVLHDSPFGRCVVGSLYFSRMMTILWGLFRMYIMS